MSKRESRKFSGMVDIMQHPDGTVSIVVTNSDTKCIHLITDAERIDLIGGVIASIVTPTTVWTLPL